MIQFIEVVRAIATMLIANSHFKGVYPTDLLSFGGGFGLALFYMISGFLLANIKPNAKLTSWYTKKVVRLYIPLVILKLIEMFIGYLKIETVRQFFREFIFPASWFGASMIILYLVYYWIVKFLYAKKGMSSVWIVDIFVAISFLVMFVTKSKVGMFSLETLQIADSFGIETPYIISLPIWLTSMLVGFQLRKRYDSLKTKQKGKKKWLYIGGTFIFMIAFFVVKLFEKRGAETVLIISLPAIYVGFAYCVFCFLRELEEKVQKFPDNVLKQVVFLVSSCSLEIYYIQFPWIHLFRNYVFPLNWILIVSVTVVSGYVLHRISDIVFDMFMRKVGK